jgi:hypothetical protein
MRDIPRPPRTSRAWRAGIGMDRRNVVYYIFLNSAGQPIGIREDMATPFQPTHFNSGPA